MRTVEEIISLLGGPEPGLFVSSTVETLALP